MRGFVKGLAAFAKPPQTAAPAFPQARRWARKTHGLPDDSSPVRAWRCCSPAARPPRRRTAARSIRSRCRRSQSPTIPTRPPRSCSAARPKPAPLAARSIGYYTSGCLAGGVALPINGKTWQVMRLSRNRNWGHPNLIKFLERFAEKAPKVGWQRTAGRRHGAAARRPDADRPLEPSGRARRRHLAHADAGPRADAPGARGDDGDQHRRRRLEGREPDRSGRRRISRCSRPPRRTRRSSACWSIPAIKKALCRDVTGDRSWLHKVRPVYGHNYHFHIRIGCPAGRRAASRSRRRRPTKAAARISTAWFTRRR